MKIEYHPAVETELAEIRAYYDDRVPGLGAEFLEEFFGFVERVAESPARWMTLEHGIRRALMKRFPYTIYFRVHSEEVIRITTVKHNRRHPGLGRSRK